MIAARFELALAVLVGALGLFLWVMAPGYMGADQSLATSLAPLAIASIGFTFGIVWMIRLARARREPDADHWRYRER